MTATIKKPPRRIAVRASTFKSKFELKLATQIKQAEGKVVYEHGGILYLNKPSTYTPDFTLANGIIIEAKGHFDSDARVKMLQVKKQYPELDIRFVFQDAKVRLNKTSKTTYAMWADKNGFKWANYVIPPEWFAEDTKVELKSKTLEELIQLNYSNLTEK